ncbi:MAG TPA: hypothetical protein VFS54_07590 [Solirubrobacterales bacterium]|nr:hypothetical protein [Solirubrobacterales bacterium]
MKRWRVILVLAAAVAILALPAGAAAKPGYVVKPKGLQLQLGLPASKGYSASIVTAGHRQVVLRVSRGEVFARYTALGKVSRKGIEADFGSFGQISLRFRSKRRFHPSLIPGLKLPKFLQDQCKGRRTVTESGVFVGNVRFEGERGFTRIRANRRKGKVIRSYRRVCKGKRPTFASKIREESTVLTAEAKRLGITRFLLMAEASLGIGDEEFAFTVGIAGESEKVGRVAVDKGTLTFEEFDSIATSPPGKRPLTAKVKLRKPFEGIASYMEEGSAPPTWTGDLGIRLPGSGLVPLAGPEFEAELCRGDREAFEDCLDSVLEDEPFRYGSGSHSQPLALARLSSLR